MNLIFVSTTPENLQNLPKLNFSKSFQDGESSASFSYSPINHNNDCEAVFIVSSDLMLFFQNRSEVYEDERFNALCGFIEDKIEILLNINKKPEKSFYAFHSHYDIFDDETFYGKSSYLSDDSHIVWGFSHQETDEIYKQLSSNKDLSNITNGLIEIMKGNDESK